MRASKTQFSFGTLVVYISGLGKKGMDYFALGETLATTALFLEEVAREVVGRARFGAPALGEARELGSF